MPAAAKTTDAKIIRAARRLIERRGAAAFSMSEVAASVGVRTPSLYGRFADSAALLAAVELDVLQTLDRALAALPRSADPAVALKAVTRAHRRFAKAHPQSYLLIFGPHVEHTEQGRRLRVAALAHILVPLAALVGEAKALLAARTLTPFVHGFVSMEIAGAFRLGGGLDAAFDNGVATILAGLDRNRASLPP